MPTMTNHDAVANPAALGRSPEVVALEAELKVIQQHQRKLPPRIHALPVDAPDPDAKLASIIAEAQVLSARERDVQNRLLGADVLTRLQCLGAAPYWEGGEG